MASSATMDIKWRIDVEEFDGVIDRLPNQIDDLAQAAAAGIVADIVLLFGTGPRGRAYRRGKRIHYASQPKNPPNTDIGTLINSIHYYRLALAHYRVADGVFYGLLLELGTEHIIKRPFVTPVFEIWRQSKFADLAMEQGLFQ